MDEIQMTVEVKFLYLSMKVTCILSQWVPVTLVWADPLRIKGSERVGWGLEPSSKLFAVQQDRYVTVNSVPYGKFWGGSLQAVPTVPLISAETDCEGGDKNETVGRDDFV